MSAKKETFRPAPRLETTEVVCESTIEGDDYLIIKDGELWSRRIALHPENARKLRNWLTVALPERRSVVKELTPRVLDMQCPHGVKFGDCVPCLRAEVEQMWENFAQLKKESQEKPSE